MTTEAVMTVRGWLEMEEGPVGSVCTVRRLEKVQRRWQQPQCSSCCIRFVCVLCDPHMSRLRCQSARTRMLVAVVAEGLVEREEEVVRMEAALQVV